MKNMKIKARLLVSLGCVVLLALISVITALIGSVVSEEKYLSVIEEDMQNSQDLLNVRIHMNTAARYVRDMALQGYSAEMESQINERLSVMDASLSEFMTSYPFSDGNAAAYQSSVQRWETAVGTIVSEIRAGNNARAQELIVNECTPTLNEVTGQALALSDAMAVYVDDTLQSARNISQALMWGAVALTVFSFAVTLVLSFKLVKDITQPLSEAEKAMVAMSEGNLKYPTSYKSDNEIGTMVQAVRTGQKVLDDVVKDISRVTAEMAGGNFDVDLNVTYPGDLAPIQKSIRQLIQRLNEAMTQIVEAAVQVDSGADQVSSGAQTLAQGATEQASSVVELSSTLSTISDSAKENAEAAQKSREESEESGKHVETCVSYMHEMVGAMENISESSTKIAQIISTIENIAFQTNILALNAAVEAARAGSAGKSFAIVANEIRTLASKSDEAAKATKDLIEESIVAVNNGSEIVSKVSDALNQTNEFSSRAVERVSHIAEAVNEETVSIAQVVEGIDQISAVIQTNSATSQQSAAASEELSSQAAVMRRIMASFKLRGMPASEVAVSSVDFSSGGNEDYSYSGASSDTFAYTPDVSDKY